MNPIIYKEEILDLFKMEEAMCKLINDNKKGTGFFCETVNENFPMKYWLFTQNHVLNETNIKLNKIINFEYYTGDKYIIKEIKIDGKRKVYTNKELNYTCIEIFKSDGIKKYFKVDPILLD